MSLDKFAGLFSSSAKSLADSARSIELYAEIMESQMETQNALLSTLVDKIDQVIDKKADKEYKKGDGNGVGGSGFTAMIGGLAANGAKAADGMMAFAKAVPAFTKGLKNFTKAMEFWDKVPDSAVEGFTKSINELVKKFSEMDFASVQKGADALGSMSQSIAVFGLTMMVASAAYAIIGPAAMLTVIPTIAGFAWVFGKVGEAQEKVEGGAQTIAWMGLAIITFGAAMGVTLQLAGGSIAAFAKGALVLTAGIAGFGLLFSMLGNFSEKITDGAQAAAWMGIGIASLGLGMAAWQAFGITYDTILHTAAGVAAVGLAFGLIGVVSRYIQSGAAAMLLTGVSIAILAGGIAMFDLLGVGWDDLALASAALVGTGLAFAGAGYLAPFIALGAIAIAGAGAALFLLAGGIGILNLTYKKAMGLFEPSTVDPTKTNMEAMVGGIASAFAINPAQSAMMAAGAAALLVAAGAMIVLSGGIWAMQRFTDSGLFMMTKDGTKMSLMIGAIVDSFSIGVIDSAKMLAGAAAMIVVGGAMMVLSPGIWAMQRFTDSALWKPSVIKPAWADGNMTNLDLMVGSIVNAFSISVVDSAKMAVGSAALMASSAALLVMSAGIWGINKHVASDLWKQASLKPAWADGPITTFDLMLGSVKNTMLMSAGEIARLGISVPVWLGLGSSIMRIASGVSGFVDIFKSNIDPKDLTEALSTVMTTVAQSVIDNGPGGGLVAWAKVFASIEMFKESGQMLTGLADGVQKFAELKFPQYDKDGNVTSYLTLNDGVFTKVAMNMKLIIKAITGVLTEVGQAQGEVGWFSKSAGEKGADIIRGIGGNLVDIADFVQNVASLRVPRVDKDGNVVEGQYTMLDPKSLEEGGSVRRNIQNMILAMTSALGAVGKSPDAESSWWFGKSNIEKGKAVIMGVAGDIKSIADAVVALAKLEDVEKAKTRIRQALSILPELITELAPKYEKVKGEDGMVSQIDRIKGFVGGLAGNQDPLEKLADSFERIAKSIGKFGDAYGKFDEESMEKHKLLIDSLVTFSEVDPTALEAVSDKGQKLMEYMAQGQVVQVQQVATQTAPTEPAPAPQKQDQKGTKQVGGAQPAPQQMSTKQMEELLETMQATLVQIKNQLGGTLRVKDADGGLFG